MKDINAVSEITYQDIADYIRLDELTNDDVNTLINLLAVAKQYILSYTGLTATQMDLYADFVIVVLILCQDMWDNRTMYVDNNNLNKVVDTILGMHSVNLL
ncbi:MAG: phage gp6-like head-tail connector protein [Clostridia bacterium]|nr:phage gp6-like head-tail connector protein [Clostridia bacterium]